MRKPHLALLLALTCAALALEQAPAFALHLSPRTDFATGNGPSAVAAADVNGDGEMDLVATNFAAETGDSVSVLLGTGHGTFGARTDFATGTGPFAVALADLDGDGRLDIATANYAANTISVLYGNGNGTFAPKVDLATGAGPNGIAIGDFDRDGRPDLITANYLAGTVSVLRNRGARAFAVRTDFTTGAGPAALTVADGDRDGLLDIYVADFDAGAVSWLRGDGNGGVASRIDIPSGAQPNSVQVADLDGLGPLDIVTANLGSGTVGIAMAGASGVYSALLANSAASAPSAVAIADMDGDDDPDLVVTNYGATGTGNSISVFFNTGSHSGTFGSRTEYTTSAGAFALALADFDDDGHYDVAVAAQAANVVSVLRSDAAPLYGGRIGTPIGSTPWDIATGDLDLDGKADAVTANFGISAVTVSRGDGAGGYTATVNAATAQGPSAVALADFNRDGRLDIVTANVGSQPSGGGHTVSVLLGTGGIGFAPHVEYETGIYPTAVAVGDMNGDGRLDIVTANSGNVFSASYANTISVLLGDGAGGFAAKQDFPTGPNPQAIALGDFNGDHILDVVTANRDYTSNGNTLSVLLGQAGFQTFGGFAPKVDYVAGTGVIGVALGDLNGDGKLDLVAANYGGGVVGSEGHTVSVLLGNGLGGFGSKTDFATGSRPSDLRIADLDRDGHADVATSNYNDNTVSVLLGDGNGGLAPPVAFATGVQPSAVTLGDMNRDGRFDLLTADLASTGFSTLLTPTPSRLTLTADAAFPALGGPLTLRAAVSTTLAGAPASGAVKFFDSGLLIGTASLVSGVASLTLPAGQYAYRRFSAVFPGDARYEGSLGDLVVAHASYVDVETSDGIATVALAPPSPDPAQVSTALSFTLPRRGHASLAVFDVRGRRIRTLISGELPSGAHSREWDLRDAQGHAVPAGIYFARLEAADGRWTRRFAVVR